MKGCNVSYMCVNGCRNSAACLDCCQKPCDRIHDLCDITKGGEIKQNLSQIIFAIFYTYSVIAGNGNLPVDVFMDLEKSLLNSIKRGRRELPPWKVSNYPQFSDIELHHEIRFRH